MESRLSTLRERIALLAAIDRDRQVFGASTHDYEVAPPLTRAELAAIERRLGVALPEEVRHFLCEVGARGAGPYYGLLELAAAHDASPLRPFPLEAEGDIVPDGVVPQDGCVIVADHGCGYSSLLVVKGPRRGEVWSDFTYGHGPIVPEAPSFVAWYEAWIERALIEWAERAAPQIALEGPEHPAELEALSIVFDVLSAIETPLPRLARTLGYLHMREQRWDDADAAFIAAAAGTDDVSQLSEQERQARLHRDRARLNHVRGDHSRAIAEARAGLKLDATWYSTQDELRAALERALFDAGRTEEALEVLDARAAQCFFDFELHHRLATERLARNDVDGAGAALERAASMSNIAGATATFEQRVARSFDPIIASLRAGGRGVDAEALEARADLLLRAN